ncbi:MAG: PSD1 and planctomycete cytochrome C domain-containing protein [Planctomycetota bacterium]|nr:PSD1 and planctomycete cytochrome C domain-containing protein [Planctomycetota bacterium]
MIKAVLAPVAAAALAWLAAQEPARPVDFAREVLPVLEAHCFGCHGTTKHKAGLRLDQRAAAFAGARYGKDPVIVAGSREESELWQLIASDLEDERMPPADSDVAALTPEQIETLGRWIDEGAPWPDDGRPAVWPAKHWAYDAPATILVPEALTEAASSHPIDRFLAARAIDRGVTITREADRATLLRRASLDLIGLPPSLEELDVFLADERADAWPRAIQRLLASPHYGEKQARWWLDLARYADSHGYEKDGDREMGRWREWVIEAFNGDLPYDEFSILQLAGDLLPNATPEQILATGFHRNTMLNDEGGTDDEEFRVAALHDRVGTTATVWMGSTLACAQCHDHKYDPFSQKDYYRLFALLNDTADGGKTAGPTISVPYQRDAAEIARIERALAKLREPAASPTLAGAEPQDWIWVSGLTPPAAQRSEWTPASFEDEELGLVREQSAPELVQHFVERAEFAPAVLAEDRIFVWVRLDPEQAPNTVMLQFHQNGSWEHRAYWGEDRIPWGGLGEEKPAHHRVGELPETGTWTRLEVSAAEVGLDPQRALDGIAFSQHGGRAWWADAGVRSAQAASIETRSKIMALEAERPMPPATMVLQRRAEPRETHLLLKGSFLSPGERIEAGLPALFAPKDRPIRERLELARWLVSTENPLAARVLVNRVWHEVFGRGLVETVEDFGTQGSPATHPELLDWLAAWFMEHDWSLKQLYALLLESAAYRQPAASSAEAHAQDPQNLWLGRAPRLRLDAEELRDLGLSVSGLLVPEIGGPSVMPYQPAGVDNAPYAGDRWSTAQGPERWRRGIYTFWRRSAPYATFAAFDAPSREFICTRRARSNTPLQALALLNDPAFWEMAEALGRRMRAEASSDDAERIAHGFRLCAARSPDAMEAELLLSLLSAERAEHGDEDRAWTLLANVLLNLDETIVK